MGKIDIKCGLDPKFNPIVIIYVSEGDSIGQTMTLQADGAINFGMDVITQAEKAKMSQLVAKKLVSEGRTEEQVEDFLTGIGDN